MRALVCLSLVMGGLASAGDLTVNMSGFEDEKGPAIVYLWTKADGFPSKTELASVNRSVPVKGGMATVTFPGVAPGTYAVSVTHDQNSNGKLDTGFMGKPKEGYGTSNNPANKLSAPSFDQCKITIDASAKSIDIKMRY